MQSSDFSFQIVCFTSIIKGLAGYCEVNAPYCHPPTRFENCIERIMSDTHNEHESAIKTPKQLIVAIAASFIIPIICIVLLVQYVTSDRKAGVGSQAQSPEAIAARLKPVADEGFTLKDMNAPKQLQAGAEVYKAVCAACHATGAAGAPKFGDAASWSVRIAQGYATLLKHGIEGLRAMPAKGGNPDLDDVEVARAIVYMANESGAKFPEPQVKAPEAATATQQASAPAVPAAEATPAPAQK
jgi:cytochrome c5